MRSLALRRLKRTAMIGRLSADTLLRFAGLIGVDPTMVDIARSSVHAEHSRERCKDHHGDRIRQLILRTAIEDALRRKRAQKPQSARGEADGQDLATAEGERSKAFCCPGWRTCCPLGYRKLTEQSRGEPMTRIQFSAPELDVLAASVAGEIQTQARQQSLPMLFLDVQPVDLTFSRGGYFAAMHDSGGNILSGSSWLLPDDITNQLGRKIATLLGIPWKPTPELWAVIHEQ